MRFATIAIMATALFANNVEARRHRRNPDAVCVVDGAGVADALDGYIKLDQHTTRRGVVRKLKTWGSFTNLAVTDDNEYKLQIFDGAACTGDGGDVATTKDFLGKRGRIGLILQRDSTLGADLVLADLTGQFIQLQDKDDTELACCEIVDFVKPALSLSLGEDVKEGRKSKRGGKKNGRKNKKNGKKGKKGGRTLAEMWTQN